MLRKPITLITAALAGIVFNVAIPAASMAAPMPVVASSILSPPDAIAEIRTRKPVRRNNAGAAAFMGLFGAVLGGVIASNRYDNYSNYTYGPPADYGYAPGYYPNQGFRSGERRPWRTPPLGPLQDRKA